MTSGDCESDIGRESGVSRGRRTSARELADILNSVPHVIWSSGPDGQPNFISEQWSLVPSSAFVAFGPRTGVV